MNRWLILAGYALLTASTQLLWLTYAPIAKESVGALHTSVGNIGWLSAIFQLIYLLLALPTGRWLDRHFPAALAPVMGVVAFGLLLNAVINVYWWAVGHYTLQSAGFNIVLNPALATWFWGLGPRNAASVPPLSVG